MTASETKRLLYAEGLDLCARFGEANQIQAPSYRDKVTGWGTWAKFGFYHRGVITVDVAACRLPSLSPYSWTWPRYKADLTPLGVVCHEYGHHVAAVFRERAVLAPKVRLARAKEKPLTSYEPNLSETFAESFRLFLTNPTLLAGLRPLRFAALRSHLVPVEERDWTVLLQDSPRHLQAAERALGWRSR